MSSKLPEQLETLVLAAGFGSLRAWATAAGICPIGLASSRSRGERIGAHRLAALLRVAAQKIDPATLRAALTLPPRAEARR